MATKEYCPASASEIYTPMSMLDSDSVNVDLRRKYDEATSSLVQNLRDMAQHVDARLTKYEKELDAPSSAPQQKMRREKMLKNVREGVINIRQCLDEECKGLEEQEPLVVFRKQTQACQSSADKQLERLLDHIQGLGLDLQSIPSVAHWQSCEQEHDIPGRSAALDSQVSSPCGGSHLAQPSSRSVFDVAHSPAMGVLSSGLSASGANAFDEMPGKRDTGDRPGALHARLPEPSPDQTPRVKNWAILQEQNAKLAAILAQHDIKLNTGGFR